MRVALMRVIAVVAAAGFGCGTGAGTGDGRPSLVSSESTLAPGTEAYVCKRLTLTANVDIHAFRMRAPGGAHHTVLSADSSPTQPDGIDRCTPFTHGDTSIGIFGPGMLEYTLPAGVAVALLRGHQLLMNMHLLNAHTMPLDVEQPGLL